MAYKVSTPALLKEGYSIHSLQAQIIGLFALELLVSRYPTFQTHYFLGFLDGGAKV